MDRKQQLLEQQAKIQAELAKIEQQEKESVKQLEQKARELVAKFFTEYGNAYILEKDGDSERINLIQKVKFLKVNDCKSFQLVLYCQTIGYHRDNVDARTCAASNTLYYHSIYCTANFEGKIRGWGKMYKPLKEDVAENKICNMINTIAERLLHGNYKLIKQWK